MTLTERQEKESKILEALSKDFTPAEYAGLQSLLCKQTDRRIDIIYYSIFIMGAKPCKK